MKVTERLLQKVANHLPLRIIDHDGKPYLRRYYVCTIPLINLRVYLHHFVDSDPVGLHNHPWLFGCSILLSGKYQEERRWCQIPNQRNIRFLNLVGADDLHRVLLFRDGANNPMSVWSIFIHSRLVMTWGTLKDKGAFTQYWEEHGEHERKNGHSQWHLKAKKGKELLNPDGTVRSVPL